MLIISDQWIATKYNQIRDTLTETLYCKYLTRKYHLAQTTYGNIYWRGIGLARKSLPLSTNIQLTKILNGWLNTGEQQTHMHQTSECPCCGWPQETQLHKF